MVAIKTEPKYDSDKAWEDDSFLTNEQLMVAVKLAQQASMNPVVNPKDLVRGMRCVCGRDLWEVLETHPLFTAVRCSQCLGPGVMRPIQDLYKEMKEKGLITK